MGRDFNLFFTLSFLCLTLVQLTRYCELITVCSGHLIITSQVLKINILLILVFFIYTLCFLELSVFSSRSVFDFIIIILTFLLWFLFLYALTSLFAVVFLFELLSILVLLLLVSSAFTTFRNPLCGVSLQNSNTNSQNLNGFLHFFWVSLISSILLFLSIVYFKSFFFSFEWSFLEVSFVYVVNGLFLFNFPLQNIIWITLLIAIFIKTGVAPFFIWKVVAFKNSSLVTIFFYTVIYYYFFIIFLFLFFLSYLPTFMAYFIFSFMVLFSIGFVVLFLILCETTYLKVFLALSSVFNSLFIFCTMASTDNTLITFIL